TSKGDWWFVHFQDAGVYGRIPHLQPVIWQNDWPMMGHVNGNGSGEPVASFHKPVTSQNTSMTAPQTSDEFDSPKLGLQWQWHANHSDKWYSTIARPGWLRLQPQLAEASLHAQPSLLLQKFPARCFSVETAFEFVPDQDGEEAGLVLTGETQA